MTSKPVNTRRRALKESKSTVENSSETREIILSAARKEFANHGFSGARIKSIAEMAGMNMQAIYYHFESKEGLYTAALQDGYRLMREEYTPSSASLAPRDAMVEFIKDFFDVLLRHRDVVDLVADENRHKGVHLAQGGKTIRDVNTPFLESFKSIFQRGIDNGTFRADLDVVQTWISAISICQMYLVNSYTISNIVGFQVDDEAHIKQRRQHVVDFILGAIAIPHEGARVHQA